MDYLLGFWTALVDGGQSFAQRSMDMIISHPNTWLAAVMMTVILPALWAIWFGVSRSRLTENHDRVVDKSWEVLGLLEGFVQNGDYRGAVNFLRYSIDQRVVEECVLSAFERAGAQVIRGKVVNSGNQLDRYIRYEGQTWVVISVGYPGSIPKQVIHKQEKLCQKSNSKALLVHVGKSPAAPNGAGSIGNHLRVIYGKELVDFLAGHSPLRSVI